MSDAKKIGLAVAGIAVLVGILVCLLVRRHHAGHAELAFHPVSLSEQMNGALSTSWVPNDDPGNNLASLPMGLQELGGVLFDVKGLIQLQGQCWVKRGYGFPERVEGIPVHRSCQRVHILHANRGSGEPLGNVVASLVLHYQNGKQARLDIRHREHVLDFWSWGRSETPTDTNSVVAWTGDSPATQRRGLGVRLCRTTFQNPQPGKVIESIDYVSAMAGPAPFLVALTVD